MSTDDIIYLTILFLSIAFGHVYSQLKSHKELVGSVVGFLITVYVCGYHTTHPLVLTGLTVLLIKVVNIRYLHVVSFAVGFSYLLFFRVCHYVGLPMANPHTNAVQMILCLKMAGLCFEIHDTWCRKRELEKLDDNDMKKELKLKMIYEDVTPSALEVFHYAFCYIGVLTGPYYRYSTYKDMINSKHRHSNGRAGYFYDMLERIKVVPVCAALFLLSSYLFPLSFAESHEIFEDYNFMYRVWYMTPIFFTFRMRIYSGFALAECVCIMAGLGAYPESSCPRPGQGPTKYSTDDRDAKEEKYNFETVHNIDEWGSDFTPTVRAGMRCWNMTVQYWLAVNVYKRLKLPKPLKEAITMLVSAFWHGVYSGYYLSMLTVPFILSVEDYYDRKVKRNLSQRGQRVYDFFSWFLKMQHFAYMGMAFLLLRVDAIIHYWRSIGFLFHMIILIMHAIAQYINLISSKVEKKLQKAKNAAMLGDVRYLVVDKRDCEISDKRNLVAPGKKFE